MAAALLHDIRANALRLSRGKTATHPLSKWGQALPDHAVADVPDMYVGGRQAGI